MTPWEPALLRGTDGSTLGAWARQPAAITRWEVRVETGAVVRVRASWSRRRRSGGGLLVLRLAELTVPALLTLARGAR